MASERSWARQLVPRFLLVALVAVGAWLWQSGWWPQARELRWQLGAERAFLSEAEIQIWNLGGELLKREVFFFSQGAPPELVQRLSVKDGEYLIRIFLKPTRGGPPTYEERRIQMKERAYVLPLRGAGKYETEFRGPPG